MRHKHRMLAALAIGLALLIAISAGFWGLTRVPPRGLLVPGATDIQVQAHGLGEQQITYQVPGKPYAWYAPLAINLEADGWTVQVFTRGGLHAPSDVYWRISPLLFVYVSEEVTVQGDPNVVRLSVYRTIILPGRLQFP